MRGILGGKLDDLERLVLELKFTVRRRKKEMVASRYVGIKGRWHLKAKEVGKDKIKFDFHWDWLVHLAYVFGSDHTKRPLVYFEHFLRPRFAKFGLKVIKLARSK